MCPNHSLKGKAQKIAIIHISLSLSGFLFYILYPIYHQKRVSSDIEPFCLNVTSQPKNTYLLERQIKNTSNEKQVPCENIWKDLIWVNNGCNENIVVFLIVLSLILGDLSLNCMLLYAVNKGKNYLFVPWFFSQAIRILFCVTAICLIMSFYVFDDWTRRKVSSNNTVQTNTSKVNGGSM